jgi:hypothetical protein
MALIPGTLSNNQTFPGTPQALLNLFAQFLSAPPSKKTLFVQTSSAGVPTDGSAVWFNSSSNTINVYSAGAWTPATVTTVGGTAVSSISGLTGSQLAPGTITSTQIQGYTITPALLTANSSTATNITWDRFGNFTITGTLNANSVNASGFTNNSVPASALGTDVGAAPWRTVTSASTSGQKTAAAGDRIMADTTSAAWTLTLPSAPTTGTMITVVDSASKWNTNNLTISTPSGATGGYALIEGASDTLVCDQAHKIITLIYTGTTWRVFN